jgi:hypothetical protein
MSSAVIWVPGLQSDFVGMHESVVDPADKGGNCRAGRFCMRGIIGTGRHGSDPAETNCSNSPRNESLT